MDQGQWSLKDPSMYDLEVTDKVFHTDFVEVHKHIKIERYLTSIIQKIWKYKFKTHLSSIIENIWKYKWFSCDREK